ncbi:DUF349 domain-containing protein [Sunxiuqinia elliptica]|uniref:DUF349 domain-containing protein n=1 Tax=Sunxiuqinia elliptica TaxID=655355 RepID=A0A1I2JJG7_9BACT|nr:DUF349 domain-containing protein [Sunxiuqinia elliptica]SFF52966.1 protein of unknown function [Sunxiuqinia elliptica]
MKSEDLKNSNDELKATPQEGDAANAPELNPENHTEEKTETSDDPVVEESKAETAPAEEQTVENEAEPEAKDETTEEEKAPEAEEEIVAEEPETPVEESEEPKEEPAATEPVAEEQPKEKEERAPMDYSTLTEVELINAMRDLLENHAEEDIKADIDIIKLNFYKKHRAQADEEKKKFVEDGGAEEDFEASNAPYEDDLRNLLKEFRQIRNKQHRELEDEKEENLQRKYEIIEEIKNLVNRKESINKTFQEFRELQQEWRDIGLVPQSKLKDLWETYHHHVENFYDYIKINRELRDLDLKKNMEAKINLCEKAEELLVEPSVIKAFNILQKYHEQWREIGPVPRDKKEELWERFKAATSKINKKHQAYFEGRKQEQKKNLEAKTVLCEKAEEIANHEIKNHKDWDKKSRELIELQKVWRTIGFAPKKDNNRIYERFRSACDKFFDAKREFYAQNKELQMNNLQMKTDLCVQAEALKDSTDWRKTTEEFIHIQKKWKEIGPVPRKHSDAIWKRFRAACDFFFDNKSEHFHHVDEEQVENLQLKKDLIEEVKNFEPSKDDDADLQQIKEFQRRWTDIGYVPFKEKDAIQNEFRDAINNHFDSLKIDEQKRNLLRFKTKMSNISGSTRGNNKMRYERDKYVNKLKQLENDLILLNNNVGFFANTKNAESLIDDVNRKIQETQEKIEFLKEKIRIIDSMEEED